LHRPPNAALELRAGILQGFQSGRQDAVKMIELAPQAVRGIGEHAVQFLRLAARQINDVRRIRHHVGNFRLRIIQKNLRTRQDRSDARVQIGDQPVDFFLFVSRISKKSAISIAPWTTRAIAATMLKIISHVSIIAPGVLPRGPLHVASPLSTGSFRQSRTSRLEHQDFEASRR